MLNNSDKSMACKSKWTISWQTYTWDSGRQIKWWLTEVLGQPKINKHFLTREECEKWGKEGNGKP